MRPSCTPFPLPYMKKAATRPKRPNPPIPMRTASPASLVKPAVAVLDAVALTDDEVLEEPVDVPMAVLDAATNVVVAAVPVVLKLAEDEETTTSPMDGSR